MDRFIVERSRLQPNSWVLTDRENKIVVVFEDGKFNETQRVSPRAVIIRRSAFHNHTGLNTTKTKDCAYIVENAQSGDYI